MEKLDGKTFDVVGDNIEKLKELFPEVVTDGKINFEKLKQVLGEQVEKSKERYDFTWNGKSEAIQLAQKQTTGTLRPCKVESVNWDTTQNLYIEGDNLEVLRTLQSSYRNKVKMIYIDPPYNTGKDFVYKDNFRDNIKSYKEKLNENYKSNAETNGSYHTNWLNMMYPRLKLARNILSDDGVVFISIDENEGSNLKSICDEIFGEQNFISSIIWQKKTGASDARSIATITEEILVYVKNNEKVSEIFTKNKDSYDLKRYKHEDEHRELRGPYYIDNLDRGGLQYSDSMNYGIECPDGTITYPNGRKNYVNEGWIWKWSKEKVEWAIQNDFIEFRRSDSKESGWSVCYKNYLFVDNENKPIDRAAPHKNLINDVLNADAAKDIKNVFGSNLFKYSKPVKLIKRLISMVKINDNDIIMDFFAGSATTGVSVLEYNLEQEKKARFILVQLPETIKENTESLKELGLNNISELGRERLRLSIKNKINDSSIKVTPSEIGFKVFKLDETNLHTWDSDDDNIEKNLLDLVNPLKKGRTQEDVVYEILLKYGVDLTVPIEDKEISGNKIYDVGMGYLLICLEENINLNVIEEIAKKKPTRVVFYDEGFKDDTVRTNAQQILKRYGVEDVRVI